MGRSTCNLQPTCNMVHQGGVGTELIADVFTALGDYIAIGQDMVRSPAFPYQRLFVSSENFK